MSGQEKPGNAEPQLGSSSACAELGLGVPGIPPGYKQTEVGVIPEEWNSEPCSKLCVKIQDGTHFSPTIRGNDYLYVTSKNIRFGYLDISTADRIDSAQHDAIYKRCDVKHGDLLLTKDGANTGNAALNTLSEQFSLLSSVAFLRFDSKQHSAAYFLQQCLSAQGQQRMKDAMSGNAITRLTLEKIRKLRFPVAPLPEQRAIATALSDVDGLIESLEHLIAKKRDLKQAAMQQLLAPPSSGQPGQTRLPGFHGEWEKISMGKHASLKARIGWQSLTTEEYLDSGSHYLVTGTDFIGGRVHWSLCHFVDEWRYKQDQNIQLNQGDVLLTKDGTIGKVGYVDKLDKPATLNSGVFVIRPIGKSFNPLFLFYVLNSRIFDDFLKKITAGSTITHLYQKDFVTFEFFAPSLLEQTAIAEILSDMDAEIQGLETKLSKTRLLKQGMMQELLTGRIRLV